MILLLRRIKASFTVILRSQRFFDNIRDNLNTNDFSVSQIGQSRNELLCSKKVKNCIDVTNLESYILSLTGVDDCNPLYEFIDEKDKWYKSPVIPLILTAIVTGLTLWSALDNLNLMYWDKVTRVAIPVIISTASYTVYRHFKEESII